MKPQQWAERMPWELVAAAAMLVLLGWMGIRRAEVFVGGVEGAANKQLVWAALAACVMAAATVPNYRWLGKWSFALLGLTLLLLVAVFWYPPVNGARRWIRLGSVSVQPSELAKLALVLCLARWFMFRRNVRRLPALMVPMALCLVPMLFILKEPDLGTALVFPPVLLAMLLAAGARWQDLMKVALAGLLLLPVVWSQMSREQKSRVTALWEATQPGVRPSDDAYHLYASKQMLALGNTWGSLWQGDVADDPAAYNLPAAQTDFIFCVIGERLGIPGLLLVMLLYVWMVRRGLQIAAATREPFGRLTAVGLVTLLAFQALVNMAMTVGLAPITGLALPFVSYGGSSLVANGLAIGLLLNISIRPGFSSTDGPFSYHDPE